MDSSTVRIGQRGVLTLPRDMRRRYHLDPGDEITLLDLGDVMVLSPRRSEIDALTGQVARKLTEAGESLETILPMLREEREKYGQSR